MQNTIFVAKASIVDRQSSPWKCKLGSLKFVELLSIAVARLHWKLHCQNFIWLLPSILKAVLFEYINPFRSANTSSGILAFRRKGLSRQHRLRYRELLDWRGVVLFPPKGGLRREVTIQSPVLPNCLAPTHGLLTQSALSSYPQHHGRVTSYITQDLVLTGENSTRAALPQFHDLGTDGGLDGSLLRVGTKEIAALQTNE
jgi:hypothetical protein